MSAIVKIVITSIKYYILRTLGAFTGHLVP